MDAFRQRPSWPAPRLRRPRDTRPDLGVDRGQPRIDFAGANDHVHAVIAAIAPHDSVERFEGLGVTVLQEHGRFTGPDCVLAGETEIRARRFVVATGSSAAVPPIPGLDSVAFLTNETLFSLREAPGHLIVIGGGPIGMEMAQAHRRLGSRVTVLEAQKALGKDDVELSAIVIEACGPKAWKSWREPRS
jgi:pyruvate/2-oxoglutarate dehydrogenase complex dihydrolipoamide dehydrogenase (E3) component